MGTSTRIQEMQKKRIAYQESKKQEVINRIAQYLTEEEREILISGDGFVRVPTEEIRFQRIDTYPILIP